MVSFVPGLKVEEVSGGCCVTSTTHYIDDSVPGVVVVAGGCGYAAKSCDEIGRIAAVLSVQDRCDSIIPRECCRLVYSSNKKPSM